MARRVNAILGKRARGMRREPTPSEQKLWGKLRGSQLGGYKFRRQMVLEPYICDFFCPEKGLVVEVDGETHDRDKDAVRDEQLRARGFEVLHFTNREVADSREAVLERILATVRRLDFRFSPLGRELTHPPTPSLEKEGEQ